MDRREHADRQVVEPQTAREAVDAVSSGAMREQDPDGTNDVTNDDTDDMNEIGRARPGLGRGRLRRRRPQSDDPPAVQQPESRAAEPVSLHPETTLDPAVLDWSVSPVKVSGPLDSARGDEVPPGLAELLAEGTLARVRILPGRVITTLAGDHRWSEAGDRVRRRLYADLESEAPWPASSVGARDGGRPDDAESVAFEIAGASTSAGPTPSPGGEGWTDPEDVAVADSVRQLLAGPVGALAASHGGSIRLYAVRGGVVDVELHGACHGCPAAERTLGHAIEAELRRLHPGVAKVRQVDSRGRPVGADPGPHGGGGRGSGDGFSWLTIGRRR